MIRQEALVVLCVRVPEGIDEAVAEIINKNLNTIDPDHWILLQPEIYFLFFRQQKNGHDRALEAIRLLDAARPAHNRLSQMRIGKAVGTLMADISESGELGGHPIGPAISEAQNLTR